MIPLALFLIPVLASLLSLFFRREALRNLLLAATAAAHAGLTVSTWLSPLPGADGCWLGLDETGRLFLTLISLLFLVCSVYACGYLRPLPLEPAGPAEETGSRATFTACLLLFLSTMTLVCLSRHLGLLWVSVEATTLSSAPLIYFHRNNLSLEATWKYLLICSVGIAIALLGTMFMAVAVSPAGGLPACGLTLDELTRSGVYFDPRWLRVAFLFLLVGYGTKMGLAPLHTWLPDAHSQAPSVVSALLSGSLLNCAFLAVLRCHQVTLAAGQGEYSRELLLLFGLVSLVFGAFFIVGQRDYKRLLAYSSVEHMGIYALGMGLGGRAVFGSLLHVLNHSLVKTTLFLAAGNILLVYGTKMIPRVRGLLHASPATGILWVAGFFAITGTPPFGTFLSEWTILKTMLDQHRFWLAGGYLAALALAFIGMASPFVRMALGRSRTVQNPAPIPATMRIPLVALILCSLLLGLCIPAPLMAALEQAAKVLQ